MTAVKLLTIGEFARATRLSAKALRLYDELGLLRPARVDEWTGYRYYSPGQLERARLVAWLRRLGMPLATIKETAGLTPAETAAEVARFLRTAQAELSERERLARFLIDYLSTGEAAVNAPAPARPPLVIRCYAASDTGRVRASNQDQGYAGPSLLAVADGFGTAGDAASAAVIDALRPLESGTLPDGAPGDLLNILSDAAAAAAASVRSLAAADPAAAGSGSTLTAMYWTGSRLAMVHIGDGRAYLLRDGGLFQITHDHSVVQSLIDAGKLTPEEAASHPQRSLLLRAINAGADPDAGADIDANASADSDAKGADAGGTPSPGTGTPDLSLHDAQAGDRYLLCSDGLTSIVTAAVIRETLSEAGSSPEDAVRRLIELANEAGGPDNIACAVADVIPAG